MCFLISLISTATFLVWYLQPDKILECDPCAIEIQYIEIKREDSGVLSSWQYCVHTLEYVFSSLHFNRIRMIVPSLNDCYEEMKEHVQRTRNTVLRTYSIHSQHWPILLLFLFFTMFPFYWVISQPRMGQVKSSITVDTFWPLVSKQ